MNVIIPMAGLGSRFSNCGYTVPKPLICIAGIPMVVQLLSNLKLHSEDAVYIGLQRAVEREHQVLATIKAYLQKTGISLFPVYFDSPTRGAAETLHKIIGHLNARHRQRRTVSLDCDTIYFYDILSEIRNIPADSGSLCFFEDEGEESIFSYVRFDETSKAVTEIQEKVKISSHANTGAYGFRNAVELSKHLGKVLAKPVPEIGEFHTSTVIAEMIREGLKFQAVPVPIEDFACVGTPKQLRVFLESPIRTKSIQKGHKILFDLSSISNLPRNVPLLEDVMSVCLPDQFLQFILKMKKDGLEVELSVKEDLSSFEKLSSCEDAPGESEFIFSTWISRRRASAKGSLFPVNDSFEKIVGWV